MGRSRGRGRNATEPAVIEMFGRFRMRFGDREVQFVRRRDRQIVQYLALRAGGAASRAELMAEFWPDTDRRDAARRLRTACSTIRRAISACIGDDALDAYFRTEGSTVVLCPENVLNEADVFEEHIEYAQRAGERGDSAVARRHVAAALRLYDRPLLSGEAPAPWIVDRARMCEDLAARAREFLYGNAEGTRIA
jgi:DNA-binding SARP family transcriptional activator